MLRAISLIFLLYPVYSFCQFVSPCPDLFSYDNIGTDSWTGTLRVPIESELSGIWLKAVFDRPFDELSTDFGEAVHREPNEYLIRRPNNKIFGGTILPITITARNNPILGAPQLLGYRLNGKTLCPTNGEIPPPPPVESLSAGGGGLQSPCPALFSYEPLGVEGNRWYGNIHVRSDSDLSGVWIRVVFDKLPVEFGTVNFGTTEQKDTNEYLIKNRIQVKSGEVLQIRVHADFIPGEDPPKLLGYRLNAKTVCPENGVIVLPMPELPESPCPAMFQYEPRGPDRGIWHGNINVASPAQLSGVWMRLVFDKPVTELGTDFGEVKRRGDSDFLVKNRQHTILAGDSLKLRISPQFNPNDVAPKLVEIRLNARTVCQDISFETTTLSVAQQLISPCPEMFTYEPPGSEPDKWYGVINLMTSTQLNGLWIRIIMDRQSLQLGNWFGVVKTDDNIIYRVQNRDYKLAPGVIVPLRFFIKYNPAEPIPKLQEIKINAVTVCPSSGTETVPSSGGAFPSQNQVTPSGIEWATTAAPRPTGGRPIPRPDWGGAWKPPSATESPSQFQCGEVATKPIALLSGGAPTEEGDWPWHAALYYTGGANPEYFCGGVLVSLSHVLTAAHCAVVTSTKTPLSTSDVQVYLGKFFLNQSNRGVQYMQIRRILVHPEYDNNNYANDIAMLHLTRPADYTDWVRPACLWSEAIELNNVENREGTVVGWGYDSRGQVSDKLLKAAMPVVSKAKCIWSHKKFYKRFVNEGSKNFCAGFRNGTSVCTGDSGGGLVFPMSRSNSRWQLRGLVSLSVALQDTESRCDTSHYAVFTDVAQFLPWIEQAFNSA